MADNNEQVHPMPQSYNPRSKYDQESATTDQAKELRRQKQKKWALYIIAFIIFQTGIIVLFTMTVMKFRTPKYRVRQANSFDTFDVQSTTTPSFNLRMNAQLGVKNTNFGPYKYDNTTIYFFYRGTEIGNAIIRKSKVDFRRTKKVNVEVDLVMPASANSELANDISSGILPLTSTSRINGKVEIMFIFKKKKAANLNCTMEVNIATKELQNINCK